MQFYTTGLHNISFLQPVGGGMFGRSLAETVKFETRRGGGYVPLIVSKCVNFIKANGKKNKMHAARLSRKGEYRTENLNYEKSKLL